jgi:DnaK suppressor protein
MMDARGIMRTDIDFSEFRALLEAQKLEVQNKIEQETQYVKGFPDAVPDSLDAAAIEQTRGKSYEWIGYLQKKQELIDAAFLRLDSSTYGICVNCGKNIDVERLRSKPYAKYCVECKARKEENNW